MRIFQRSHFSRLLVLVALSASAALLVDYFRPTPAFCSFQSSCEEVLFSPVGQALGVPLPLVGVLGFGVCLYLSLAPADGYGRWFAPVAALAGVAGFVLVLLQLFVIGSVCVFCLIVDCSAMLLALLQIRRGKTVTPSNPRPLVRWLWVAGGVAAVAVPMAIGMAPAPEHTPQRVRDLWVPGKVTVVEVADFQCPFCRDMHRNLMQFLTKHEAEIHFVRLAIPMPKHTQSRFAARAYRCADRQGKGATMAEALFAAGDLSAESCQDLAESLHVSLPEYQSCVADPALAEELDADSKWILAVSPHGLPAVWIQDQFFFGVQSVEKLEQALKRAQQNVASTNAPAAH